MYQVQAHRISECISCWPCRLCKCKYVITFSFGDFNIKSVEKSAVFTQFTNKLQSSFMGMYYVVCVMHWRCLWLTEARLCICQVVIEFFSFKPIHEPTESKYIFPFIKINFDDSVYKCRPFYQMKVSVRQIQVDTCRNGNVVIMVNSGA